MNCNKVQRHVRAAIKAKGKSQNQLARDLGISPAYLSQILSGKRRAPLLVALDIERVTGVSLRELSAVAS